MASLKAELKSFGESFSLMAISHAIKTKSLIWRIIWPIAITTCFALMIYQMTMIVQQFLSYPVTTSFEEGREKAVMPDVTICNIYPMANDISSELTWLDYLNKIEHIRTQFPLKYVNEHRSKMGIHCEVTQTEYDYYVELLQSPALYFANFPIEFNSTDATNKNLIVDYKYLKWDWSYFPEEQSCVDNITVVYDPNYYRCLTIRTPDAYKANVRGVSVILYTNDFQESIATSFDFDLKQSHARGVRVDMHSPGSSPDMKRGVNIPPGTESTITVASTKRTRLPLPYGGTDCTSQTYVTNSNNKMLYSYDVCYDVCLQDQMLGKCGCLESSWRFTEAQLAAANYTVCGNFSFLDHRGLNTTFKIGFKEWMCAYLTKMNSVDYESCEGKCLLPCQETLYDISLDEAPWPHASQQLAFYDEYIKNNTEYENYFDSYRALSNNFTANLSSMNSIYEQLLTIDEIEKNFLQINVVMKFNKPYLLTDKQQITWDVMLSNIGGTLSLWFGLTFLMLLELVEFLYNLIVICFTKRMKANKTTPTIIKCR